MPGHLRQVAPGVLVATSRFMATSTVVLTATGAERDDDALVIDPGVHADELDALVAELGERRLRVVGGVATHAHWDHVLWHAGLGDVPRWASPRTVADAEADRADLLAEARATTAVDDDRFARLQPLDGPVPWSGPEVHLVVHDAHCPGHAALHVPERGVLVAGDMGSDVEVPLLAHGVPGPEALLAHHAGIDRLAALTPVDVAVPGHGHPCDGAMWRRRLDADRAYLDDIAAGRPSDDTRLGEPWLVEADEAMRAALAKPEWRRWTRTLPPVGGAAQAVVARLAGFLGDRPGVVGAYVALPDEVDLEPLLEAVDADRFALPRLGDDGTVTWHVDVGGRELHHLGIAQPGVDAPPVDPAELDVLLVPGRVFDRHGIRLGRGGGHYDRVVPRLRPGVPVVGVTVDERLVPRLPTEAHDAPMTHLATQSGVRALR